MFVTFREQSSSSQSKNLLLRWHILILGAIAYINISLQIIYIICIELLIKDQIRIIKIILAFG